ncbi:MULTISPECIES: type IVB secretion system protein DotA [Legionella]|uniref:Defect in organelle trafficking protein DotA n=1 Tax=Legionella drozanskii LLAP-1 TaxID=1212489 RepID=A0A0W0SVV2_9GAMM|nr:MULTISPECIES: type IVB secretion system protein DotA [Legionella]KTC87412.1 defect in organelle trafficking protein DotA [Legionella drozanskii LLAP-1]PJE08508.1 MAG: type IV secretion protein DotA [Legionella sp.]
MKKIVLSILSLLFPALTYASSGGSSLSFAPPPSDLSVVFLGNIFGMVDGVLHGTGSQIMGNMFGVFNSAVLALGGIIIMYTLLVSTMNTAQEGQMLGQKWSSIWVPMRSTLGLALLIPKASGYCLMQIFVMWIVVQGVGAADKVWGAALSYLNRGGVIVQTNMTPATSFTSGANTVAQGASTILAGQVCMAGLQNLLESQRQSYIDAKQNDSGPCSGSPSQKMQDFCNSQVPDFISTVNIVSAQQKADQATIKPLNYSVQMPNFPTGSAFASINGVCGLITWNPFSSLASVKQNIPTVSSNEIQTAQMSRAIAIQQMYLDLSTVAQVIVNNDPQLNPQQTNSNTNNGAGTQTNFSAVATQQFGVPFLNSGSPCTGPSSSCVSWGQDPSGSSAPLFSGTEFQGAIADYNGIMLPTLNLVQQAANNQNANNQRAFIQQANTQGWIMAGSYFFNLAWLNSAAINNANLTDSDTGLANPGSGFDASKAPGAFNNGQCVGQFADLCTWLGKNPAPVNQLISLINGSGILTSPLPQPSFSATGTKAESGIASSTAYGFITNSSLVSLPGQPGLTPPAFAMKFNIDINLGQFQLQSQNFPCGSVKIMFFSFCLGSLLGNIFYNIIIKNLFNFFLSMVAPIINAVVMSFLAAPLIGIGQIFQQGVAIIQQPTVNPVIALANMGVNYINFANDLWVLLIGLSVTVVMIPVFGLFILPLIALAMPLLLSWLGVMVGIGFLTAYYIPFLPYMIFTFGSIAWLTAVIEAMVAAPIVALGVTHPEGHDAFGKGEQAIMILLNVFLRPAMMIIGYIAAIALSYVSVWIINAGFSNAAAFIQGTATGLQWNYSAQNNMQSPSSWANDIKSAGQAAGQSFTGGTASTGGDAGQAAANAAAAAQANNFSSMRTGYSGWAGIYGFFFSVLIYTTMYLIVVQKAFTLITYLPDKVLRWIGGQPEGFGEQISQWGEEAKGKVEGGGKETTKAMATRDSQLQGYAEKGVAKLKGASDKGKPSVSGFGSESTPS